MRTARLFGAGISAILRGQAHHSSSATCLAPAAWSRANSLYKLSPQGRHHARVNRRRRGLEPLLGNAQANYDRGASIGSAGGRATTSCAWSGTPSRCERCRTSTQREVAVGATGPGSRTLTYPRALNELLGTKFKIVSGYPGATRSTLALERGEVEAIAAGRLAASRRGRRNGSATGKIRPLVQFTLGKADLPDVPLATRPRAQRTGNGRRSRFLPPIPCWPGH